MTEEDLIGMAMATSRSSSGNIVLLPSVPVLHTPSGDTVHAMAIGRKTEHLGYVSTQERLWVRIETLEPIRLEPIRQRSDS